MVNPIDPDFDAGIEVLPLGIWGKNEKCSLGISNFLEEISSLSHSISFLYFFALVAEEGVLISPCYSLELSIQMGISFLFSFAFCFSPFQLFVRPPQTAILLFCISFSWGWSWFLSPVQCHEPPSIVHQAFCIEDHFFSNRNSKQVSPLLWIPINCH